MRKLILSLLLLLPCMLWATPRTVNQALKLATNFRSGRAVTHHLPMAQLQLRHTITQTDGTAAAYVFTTGNQGYVIVSADDEARTILAYSDQDVFEPTSMPPSMLWMLSGYADEIASAQGKATKQADKSEFRSVPRQTKEVATIPAFSNHLEVPQAPSRMLTQTTAVGPHLGSIIWDQETPFNNMCPTDPADPSAKCATGCVATAAAQLMCAWQHPAQGRGSHSYLWEHEELGEQGTLSANYNTTYDWANMLPNYTGSYTTTQANAVAKLMYHVGVSCDMQYGGNSVNGSGALTANMARALSTYFKYANNMYLLRPDFIGKKTLVEQMTAEVQYRPVLIGASNGSGGHAFVCDGMDDNGLFHINWGWSGSSNSYFALTALDPNRQGIGGSTSKAGFTQNLVAVKWIYPEDSDSQDLTGNVQVGLVDLRADVTTTTIGSTVNIILDQLVNIGLPVWNTDLAIKICDTTGTFVGQIGALETDNNLAAGRSYDPFSKSGTFPSVPNGRYEIVACYVNNNSWYRVECAKRLYCTVNGNRVTFSQVSVDDDPETPAAPDTVTITDLTYLDAYYLSTSNGTPYWGMKVYNGTNNNIPACFLYAWANQQHYISGTYNLVEGSYELTANNSVPLMNQTGSFTLKRVAGTETQYNLPYYQLNANLTDSLGNVVVMNAKVAVDALVRNGSSYSSFSLYDQVESTALEEMPVAEPGQATKVLHNGIIYIRRGDSYYTLTGEKTEAPSVPLR